MTDSQFGDKEHLVEELPPSTKSHQFKACVWFLLLIFALLTIWCSIATGFLTRQPNGFIYKRPANHRNPKPYYNYEYYDGVELRTTTPLPTTYKLETKTIPPICWDYSGIWGGFIMMILTIAIVPRENNSRPILKSVCSVLAILASCLVSGVAIGWSWFATNAAANLLSDNERSYGEIYDKDELVEDRSRMVLLIVASVVGTAIFATLYFVFILVTYLGEMLICGCKQCNNIQHDNALFEENKVTKSFQHDGERINPGNIAAPIFCKLGHFWCTCQKYQSGKLQVGKSCEYNEKPPESQNEPSSEN